MFLQINTCTYRISLCIYKVLPGMYRITGKIFGNCKIASFSWRVATSVKVTKASFAGL